MPNERLRPQWLPRTIDARLLAGFALIALLPPLLAGTIGIRLLRGSLQDEAIRHASAHVEAAAIVLAC